MSQAVAWLAFEEWSGPPGGSVREGGVPFRMSAEALRLLALHFA